MALTGDGGDELFAGYPRYRAVWLAELVRPAAAAAAAAAGRAAIGSGCRPARGRSRSVRRWKRFVEVLGQSPARRYLEWIAIFNEARRAELYSDEFLATLPDADPLEFLAAALARCSRGATRSRRSAWPIW